MSDLTQSTQFALRTLLSPRILQKHREMGMDLEFLKVLILDTVPHDYQQYPEIVQALDDIKSGRADNFINSILQGEP